MSRGMEVSANRGEGTHRDGRPGAADGSCSVGRNGAAAIGLVARLGCHRSGVSRGGTDQTFLVVGSTRRHFSHRTGSAALRRDGDDSFCRYCRSQHFGYYPTRQHFFYSLQDGSWRVSHKGLWGILLLAVTRDRQQFSYCFDRRHLHL